MIKQLQSLLPRMDFENLKTTALINAYAALQIPLLGFVTPRVVSMTDTRSEVRIRLDRRTRNHLGVMYFGALSMGAELSIAIRAVQAIQRSGYKIDFIFKDFQCQFLKRADGHVHFICEQAAEVEQMIVQATATSERLNRTFEGYAIVENQPSEPVMKYQLTLSVKKRSTV